MKAGWIESVGRDRKNEKNDQGWKTMKIWRFGKRRRCEGGDGGEVGVSRQAKEG